MAYLAIIYMALNERRKWGELEGEEEERNKGKRKPTKTIISARAMPGLQGKDKFTHDTD